MTEHHSIIIVGAGLSGLYAAWQFRQLQQKDVVLLEARDRVGGRILSSAFGDDKDSAIDLGPAWVWPQLQPRLLSVVEKLGLQLFQQYTTGALLYESAVGKTERYNDQSSHGESYRIAGGAQQLISALQSQLPESSTRLNTQVESIVKNPLSLQATCYGKACDFTANKIILALPPRLSLQNISFTPALSDDLIQLLDKVPTWMAGHSKVVFIYDRPFWREQGLSGEVFSHYGPLSEIYDASPVDETFYALTSFIGLNAGQRKKMTNEQLLEMCMTQLLRLFGEDSQKVSDIQIKDWSLDRYTASEKDLNSVMQHPKFPQHSPRNLWDNQLILAGSEVAREYGGYIEGALMSADDAVKLASQN